MCPWIYDLEQVPLVGGELLGVKERKCEIADCKS